MRSSFSGRIRVLIGLLAAASLPGLPAARSQPKDDAKAPPAPEGVSTASGLPVPAGADVWVDRIGRPLTPVAGVLPGAVTSMKVLVFRAAGETLPWSDFVRPFVERDIVPEKGTPLELLNLHQPRLDPNVEVESTRAYATKRPDQVLVLGMLRYPAARMTLGYAVLTDGKLQNFQAVLQAQAMVRQFVRDERARRTNPPVPDGATMASPTVRLQGAQLQQLQHSILQSRIASQRVKDMAKVVVPQATGVTLSTYQTSAPLADRDFFDFYVQGTARLGWPPPISRDETQPGRPTLLFQRPFNDAVVMVRAQTNNTAPPGGAPRPVTMLYVLVMEGRINVQSLVPKTSAVPGRHGEK